MSTNPNDPCELLRRDPAAQNPSPYAAYELCGQQPLAQILARPGCVAGLRSISAALMTDEEYARYSPWQQQPPRLNDYNQHPYEPSGPALPIPTVHYALRLSDEDVARIADAVVLRLRAEADYPR